MLCVETEVKKSQISDSGLFTKAPIRKGYIIALFPQGAVVMTEADYHLAQTQGDELITKSAVRWVGNYFLCNTSIGPEEYINHSSNPNMLYHCGIMFANRNIEANEELTADYKHFLAIRDVNRFKDTHSGVVVDGVEPTTAIVESCRSLLSLLDDSTPQYKDKKKL